MDLNAGFNIYDRIGCTNVLIVGKFIQRIFQTSSIHTVCFGEQNVNVNMTFVCLQIH